MPLTTNDPGDCGCPSGVPCSPCNIPARNLTLSFTGTPTLGGPYTMTYSAVGLGGAPSWNYGCDPLGVYGVQFTMNCSAISHTITSLYTQWGFSTFSPCDDNLGNTTPTLIDYTCEPFHLHFQMVLGGHTYQIYVDG